MRVLFENPVAEPPKLSIILVDWSVRESFHVLDYLNGQRIDRSAYEILWIEWYDYRAPQIDERMKRAEYLDLPPPVDQWIALDHPKEECYHKHKMYNVGILRAKAPLITIMDSDSIVKTTFVGTLLEEFKRQPRQVLHFEQVRNFSQGFYPFNYPALEEIIGGGCVNAVKGIPVGFDGSPKSLKTEPKLWNVYNYGACFNARREDLIRFGAADEHPDYLGHICGPYEMTARLLNAGIPDRLHPHQYTYHVWHPNTGGESDRCGPSDGRGMSTTAMKILETGRARPFFENEGIQKLRKEMFPGDDLYFV